MSLMLFVCPLGEVVNLQLDSVSTEKSFPATVHDPLNLDVTSMSVGGSRSPVFTPDGSTIVKGTSSNDTRKIIASSDSPSVGYHLPLVTDHITNSSYFVVFYIVKIRLLISHTALFKNYNLYFFTLQGLKAV